MQEKELELEIEMFCPATRQEWRQWLQENHVLKKSVWLVQYKKKATIPSISWGQAVEEALCFGWIDSVRKSIDGEKFIQFFTKRKARSVWSKINKAKAQQLITAGLFAEAGLKSVEIAKQNGSWSILDNVEELIIPEDLAQAFKSRPGAEEYFLSLSKSVRKMILQWIVLAKRAETRENRIKQTAELAEQGQKPMQFR